MSFKETWKPRVDGVDDADSSAVNEIAEAVIELEEDIPERYYSKEISNNLFANALKGSASGEIVALKDVSPLEHILGVKVSSENIADIEAVKVAAYGGNLFDINSLEKIFSSAEATITDNSITLQKENSWGRIDFYWRIDKPLFGKKLNLSFNASYTDAVRDSIIAMYYFTADGVETKFLEAKASTSFDVPAYQEGVCLKISFYLDASDGNGLQSVTYSNIRIGIDEAEYEPYKAPVEYTVNADGTVDGVKSIAPATTLTTDTEGVLIEVEYNKDANKVVATLEQRLAALEAAIISQ